MFVVYIAVDGFGHVTALYSFIAAVSRREVGSREGQ
jgi:hypothetical protein